MAYSNHCIYPTIILRCRFSRKGVYLAASGCMTFCLASFHVPQSLPISTQTGVSPTVLDHYLDLEQSSLYNYLHHRQQTGANGCRPDLTQVIHLLLSLIDAVNWLKFTKTIERQSTQWWSFFLVQKTRPDIYKLTSTWYINDNPESIKVYNLAQWCGNFFL